MALHPAPDHATSPDGAWFAVLSDAPGMCRLIDFCEPEIHDMRSYRQVCDPEAAAVELPAGKKASPVRRFRAFHHVVIDDKR
ncbi:hypothetical protein ACH4Y0_21680 [Streptomyces sp. NPDC020707]|uniref:hypothetical protein n=1 Tax=Streptomyces sp. NPDC020707 TaxID=3365084 RepID=UPI0037AB22E6